MNNTLTLRDINKAIKACKGGSCIPIKRIEFDWGWIETDGVGIPSKIGLNKKTYNDLKEHFGSSWLEFDTGTTIYKKGKITKLCGLKVLKVGKMTKSKTLKDFSWGYGDGREACLDMKHGTCCGECFKEEIIKRIIELKKRIEILKSKDTIYNDIHRTEGKIEFAMEIFNITEENINEYSKTKTSSVSNL